MAARPGVGRSTVAARPVRTCPRTAARRLPRPRHHGTRLEPGPDPPARSPRRRARPRRCRHPGGGDRLPGHQAPCRRHHRSGEMRRHRRPRHGDGTASLVADRAKGDYLCYWYTGTGDARLVEHARAASAEEAIAWGRDRTARVRIRTAEARTDGIVTGIDAHKGTNGVGIRVGGNSSATAVLWPSHLAVHGDPRDSTEPCWRCQELAERPAPPRDGSPNAETAGAHATQRPDA